MPSVSGRPRPLRGSVRRLATGIGVALASSTLSVAALPALSASANDIAEPTGQAPVTNNDTMSFNGTPDLGPYFTNRAYVLLNDSDPDGDSLEICDVSTADGDAISVSTKFDPRSRNPYIDVQPVVNESGLYTVDYHACDGQFATPGTLTVTVTRIDPVEVRALRRGGLVKVTNPGVKEAVVAYGAPRAGTVRPPFARSVTLSPGASQIIRVHRPRLQYYALVSPGSAAGEGIVDVAPVRHPISISTARGRWALKVRNSGTELLRLEYGGRAQAAPLGEITLRAGRAERVTVAKRRVVYRAYTVDGELADRGVVAHPHPPRS